MPPKGWRKKKHSKAAVKVAAATTTQEDEDGIRDEEYRRRGAGSPEGGALRGSDDGEHEGSPDLPVSEQQPGEQLDEQGRDTPDRDGDESPARKLPLMAAASTVSPIEQALLDLRAAEQAQTSADALPLAAEILGRLSEDDRRKLLVMPSVQKLLDTAEAKAAESMKPGSVITDQNGRVVAKVPWTKQAMIDYYGEDDMITWTPMQSRYLSFNGVDVYVREGEDIKTPSVFKALAMEAYQAERDKRKTDEAIMERNFGALGKVMNADE